MSTKSLIQNVLKNRFILTFKMLCGRYQYIVEDYSVNCIDKYLQIQSLLLFHYCVLRWTCILSYI
jgi:hypothetical protein